MARSRRRATRRGVQKDSELQSESPSIDAEVANEEDRCPACKGDAAEEFQGVKESWIECDACKIWFHWRCAGNGGDMELINRWYCKSCMQTDSTHVISLKPPARKSSRKRTQQDYASLNSGLQSDPHRWMRLLDGKGIAEADFRKVKGGDVGLEWLNSDEHAMREPIIFEGAEGLGMKMPRSTLSVMDIAEKIGMDTPVEVIDVASQANSPGWTLGKWAEYYHSEPSQRDKIRNVISLEISGTDLAEDVLPPRIVRELDWVERFWPSKSRGKGQYPKVQLYCLMGVATAYTDWHIDFAGSSVYYHVLRGSKIFYFIRPTPSNLNAYEKWSGSEIQTQTWLGDMVDEVTKVTLHTGNTMIIPTGWIHAVYTPVDALVFGGNFLHSYNIATQLKVREIEITTRVPKKFRFPHFQKLCWYVGEKYLRDLKNREDFPQRVLEGIEALSQFLVSEVRIMERGTEQAKKEAKEQVPTDRVKDPAALARELRWRAKLAGGYLTDDEGPNPPPTKDVQTSINGHLGNGVRHKRKRALTDELFEQVPHDNKRNYRPRLWDAVSESPADVGKRVVRCRKPEDGADWKAEWMDWADEQIDNIDGEEADVVRQRNVIFKLQKTAHGLERQRVERVIEEWFWRGDNNRNSAEPSNAQTTAATSPGDRA